MDPVDRKGTVARHRPPPRKTNSTVNPHLPLDAISQASSITMI